MATKNKNKNGKRNGKRNGNGKKKNGCKMS